MTRICITGGPRTGKTTLSHGYPLFSSVGVAKVHCDDYITHPDIVALPERERWSAVSQMIADEDLRIPGPWIIEGVQVPRALRKALAARPDTRPCDRLIILRNEPFEPWTKGQASMAKGLETVLNQIQPGDTMSLVDKLRALGVEAEERR